MPHGMFYRGRLGPRRPATADVVYTDEELAWLKAVDRWRREHDGRMPSCAEVLGIARSLGYEKPRLAARSHEGRAQVTVLSIRL